MLDFFISAYRDAPYHQIILEFVAFVLGIWSVILAKKENILVYPTGLIATIITTYLLYMASYLGDMLLNAYFSVMSIYGWYKWGVVTNNQPKLAVSSTNLNQKVIGFFMFILTLVVVYAIYIIFDYKINYDNYIDILASGIFFTAMWFMALKKIENWVLWVIGDALVTPLYAYRGMGMLALQYLIFTLLAVSAYLKWKKVLESNKNLKNEYKQKS
jgi:nicotinamide mononucleotide transporter